MESLRDPFHESVPPNSPGANARKRPSAPPARTTTTTLSRHFQKVSAANAARPRAIVIQSISPLGMNATLASGMEMENMRPTTPLVTPFRNSFTPGLDVNQFMCRAAPSTKTNEGRNNQKVAAVAPSHRTPAPCPARNPTKMPIEMSGPGVVSPSARASIIWWSVIHPYVETAPSRMYGSTAYAPPKEKRPTLKKNHEMSKTRLPTDSAASTPPGSTSNASSADARDPLPILRHAMKTRPQPTRTRMNGSRA